MTRHTVPKKASNSARILHVIRISLSLKRALPKLHDLLVEHAALALQEGMPVVVPDTKASDVGGLALGHEHHFDALEAPGEARGAVRPAVVGGLRTPRADMLLRLRRTLHCSADYLLGLSDDPAVSTQQVV